MATVHFTIRDKVTLLPVPGVTVSAHNALFDDPNVGQCFNCGTTDSYGKCDLQCDPGSYVFTLSIVNQPQIITESKDYSFDSRPNNHDKFIQRVI